MLDWFFFNPQIFVGVMLVVSFLLIVILCDNVARIERE